MEFLSNFKFSNMPDAVRKQATIRYMKYLATKDGSLLEHVYIIQTACAGDARERAFYADTQKLVNLHSGHSTSGQEIYPSDAKICFEDSICIQIQKAELKCDSIFWSRKAAYTLAIYYPENFVINYVTAESQNEEADMGYLIYNIFTDLQRKGTIPKDSFSAASLPLTKRHKSAFRLEGALCFYMIISMIQE